ncbi:cytidylate kinase region [Acidimicrobium ferrooxidans DSM 10331]|uniref:(d)CMP kinase n=1 Tax=Acidimicrobium ferrooxidans (strain DSM 10331 / JCM 15462 / NBRC 103882 / ICP) TaxID=525909 RepID=C7LZW9_ACIFD|nr:cytidylate kinase region [Acidimicrobium ferrooxidans DSM 10331]
MIAIDGLSGTGKSTLAVRLADDLKIACINTGLYFRFAAHLAEAEGLAPAEVAEELRRVGDPLARYREAEALGARLRDPTLTEVLAVLTQDRLVRDAVLALERADIHALGSAVVEGRDIGTVVVPDAELKLFLVARDAVRVARRHDEGVAVLARDRVNARRAVAPALPAADAIVVDTSDVSVAALAVRVGELVAALSEVPA